jgi:hypothetical protein
VRTRKSSFNKNGLREREKEKEKVENLGKVEEGGREKRR